MGAVLKGVPEEPFSPPPGVVAAKIDPATGLRVGDGSAGVTDYFYQEFVPAEQGSSPAFSTGEKVPEEIRNQLF